jgi:carnitine 3-dehydrogenase
MNEIKQAAVVGGGVIGAGWIARLIENGINVAVYDPAPDAQQKIEAVLLNSRHAYSKLTMAPRATEGQLVYADTLADAVSDASLIIESVPERLDIKQSVYADIEQFAPTDSFIASSTSGIMPTDLQAKMKHPERLIVAHPFNPVYLLPLVEIVAGEKTSADVVERASSLYRKVGMHPLVVKKEIEAFIADRLLEAVWRESLWLVKDGIATTQDIDDAIRYGFGLRWAQMGLFETYRIAGGEAGMRHFMEQFGACLSWPWTKLMDVPEFNDELVDLIAGQSDEQSGHYSIRELERHRDDNLVVILQALKGKDWGAGKILGSYEKKCYDQAGVSDSDGAEPDLSQAIRTIDIVIPTEWTDYNNHMNESRYLECFSQGTDGFLRMIGVDADYIASGNSYFTVETHIRHLDEVAALQSVYVTTQVLAGKGKKLKLFNSLYHNDGRLLATGEHMLLHVSLETRHSSEPEAHIAEKLTEIAALHAALNLPEGAGNAIR